MLGVGVWNKTAMVLTSVELRTQRERQILKLNYKHDIFKEDIPSRSVRTNHIQEVKEASLRVWHLRAEERINEEGKTENSLCKNCVVMESLSHWRI